MKKPNKSHNAKPITDKLIEIDAKFSVSCKDLAEAIQRVGLSAKNAGKNIEDFTKELFKITGNKQKI